jgi:hypothetical protein
MAFVAGAKGSLVEYKTRIGRRCFWSKILNFGLGFDIAGAQNRSLRISADFCDLCAVRRPYGAYGTATFLMTPLMFLMTVAVFLMARLMFLMARSGLLMVLTPTRDFCGQA